MIFNKRNPYLFLSAILGLLILFASCRKEIVFYTVTVKKPYLDQMIYQDETTTATKNFFWNINNQLEGYYAVTDVIGDKGSRDSVVYIRNSDGLITGIKEVRYDTFQYAIEVPTYVSSVSKVYYDDKKKISHIVQIARGESLGVEETFIDSITFTYENKISRFDVYVKDENGEFVHEEYGLIDYDGNGNKSQVMVYTITDGTEELDSKYTFTYDSKTNALFTNDDALALDIIKNVDFIDVTASFNITRLNLEVAASSTFNENYDISYTYANDEFARPVKADIRDNGTDLGKVTFSYKVR